LAVIRSGRGDWQLTDSGVQHLLMWLSRLSPTEHGARLKKARLGLSDRIKEQLSNQQKLQNMI
jgi:hypothetical protein